MSSIKKVVLAYSGGLDTSAIVPWLKENYGCEVVAFVADVGQGAQELEGVEAKALASGASECHIVDLKEAMVAEYIYPTLKRTHDVGINVTTCFIVGHPGEGLRDYIETCLLIYKCRKFINELNLSVFNPEYETQMMENPEKYHLVFRDEKWVSTEFWNQPKILDLKYFIISKFWNRYRGVKASPTKWLYKRPSEK